MANELRNKRVAVLVENGFEQSELVEPREALQAAGATAEIVSPQSGKVKGWQHANWGDELPVDRRLDEAKAEDYDALLLPGGVMSPDKLRANAAAVKFVRHFVETGKPIAAICHGAQVLAAAKVIEGKRISAYPACSPEVELAGAKYASIAVTDAVTDGNFVTAPAWPAHPAWIAQFLAILGTRIEHT